MDHDHSSPAPAGTERQGRRSMSKAKGQNVVGGTSSEGSSSSLLISVKKAAVP